MSPRKDDELKHELEGRMPSGHSTRAEEAYEPEPPADDDIRTDADAEDLRSELARHLERATFPADRRAVLEALEAHHAPEPTLEAVRRLPEGTRYANATESARVLGGAVQGRAPAVPHADTTRGSHGSRRDHAWMERCRELPIMSPPHHRVPHHRKLR
ncbi:DUF2795 domain-containing protein [Streptomyces alfalfae]|uniref:DUF2795 domain-containing protein n=1 Tax=Streptomyces alfalfae TaxID=1642299 RepID=A0ABN4VBY6_9ACTN|nr:DUF2795 domain-containing protein [Streptomyces alfalfae]APY84658.1 hypothetical protein A7J05_01775 [Streptomyces alfalfae]